MLYKNYIQPDELILLSSHIEITPKILQELMVEHKKLVTERYEILKNAYIGNYPILSQEEKPEYKPDNRVVVNFAKYIVDTMNGFFVGIPIKVKSSDTTIDDYLNFVDKYNDQDDNNAELSKICSIYGKGYEVYYHDSNGEVAITYMSPMEAFIVYDDTNMQEPVAFVNYYLDSDKVIHGELRTRSKIIPFTDNGVLKFVSENEQKDHNFDDVPATEFIENEERMAIFEASYSMINEYNKAISEKANDVDYFADAYLKVIGPKLDKEQLANLRTNRTINLETDGEDNVVIEFMEKPNADTTQENLINRLERLIFQNSMVANINDENFGATSGIALKYKLLSMSNLAKTKERKFTSGMNRRYRIIFSSSGNNMNPDDWMKIEYKFTQNFPSNVAEEAQIASQLSGIVSQETQLSALSIVENVQDELERISKEDNPDGIVENRMFPVADGEQEQLDE